MRQASKRNRGDEAQHDAERSPHLPHHDQGTANDGRGALGAIDGGCAGLCADSEAQEEAGEKETPPCMGGEHPKRGSKGDEA